MNCQKRIKKKLQNMTVVKNAEVSYETNMAVVTYDPEVIEFEDIKDGVEEIGYEVLDQKMGPDISRSICLLVIIIASYLLLLQSNILNMLVPSRLADSKMGYGMLFVVGLLTSVHCIAMCGGISLSQSMSGLADGDKMPAFQRFLPTLLYNLGRVISYTVIGALLGLVGMIIGGGSGNGVSPLIQGILKMFAGIFMIIMGINMLGIFLWLRKFNLSIFRFRKLKKGSGKSRQPLMIGMLNGLMPCGPLQSMQIIALASGNPFVGACSMFMFSMGTVPLMMGLGSVVSALGGRFKRYIIQVGAVLVVVLGLAMFSQGRSLSGLFVWPEKTPDVSAEGEPHFEIVDGVQIVESTLSSGQYPNITVQAGVPVRWTIHAPEGSINGCNYKIIIPDYGIQYSFEYGENIIEFTPSEAGTISYTCWMGMIHGSISVVDEM